LILIFQVYDKSGEGGDKYITFALFIDYFI